MKLSVLCIAMLFTITACDSVFEFSPYQANVTDEYEDQNVKNIGELYLKNALQKDSITFITISDSHDEFGELSQAVDKINELSGIDFAVHLGDFANKGLLKEYEMYSDIVSSVSVPLITCMGNHDYLSNGGSIYAQMFGDFNFSIEYGGVQFVFFDGTHFESGKQPDLEWLDQEMRLSSSSKVILSHIPPWATDYSDDETEQFKILLESHPVLLAVHGHEHGYYYGTQIGTEVKHLIPGAINRGNLGKITIYADNTYRFELVPF